MGKTRLSKLIKSTLYSLVGITLNFAQIDMCAPFSSAYLYASIFERNVFLSMGVKAFCVLFFSPTETSRIFGLVGLILFAILGLVQLKNKDVGWLKFVCIALHVGTEIFIYSTHNVGLITLIDLAVKIAYAYVFYLALSIVGKLDGRVLANSQLAIIFLSIVALGFALSAIKLYSVSILYCVGAFFVFASALIKKSASLFVAVGLGVGSAFYSSEVNAMAFLPFCAICIVLFCDLKRIFSLLSGFMGACVFLLYLNPIEFYQIALLYFLIGEIICLFIPRSLINQAHMKNDDVTLATRYLINRHRFSLSVRMRNLKEIFARKSEILTYFKSDGKKSVLLLCERVEKDLCSRCEKYQFCRMNGLGEALEQIGRITVIKNKSAISELPPLIENECAHMASLVGKFNDFSLEMRKDIVALSVSNKVRNALSSSLKGVREILEKEEIFISQPIGFDVEKEKEICSNLALYGVVCYQALISVGPKIAVTLLVKRDTLNEYAIENGVSAVVGKSKITKSDDSVIKGIAVVELCQKPAFNAICGIASKPKEDSGSGDSHSFTKLDEGKFMCALCDGMGSGEIASEISDKAITLIEDFYKAGYDHQLTVKSVNNFLKIDSDESFSALDVMILDAIEGIVDVVKLASPPTYIKKNNHIVKLVSSSLPLGIVGEITPSISTRQIEDGDCYVFVSDGVSDAFVGDELSALINNLDARNPQKLCDTILERAQKRKANCDDMTVIACMVFYDNY